MRKDTMTAKARLAALPVLVGLVLLIGLGISSPGLSGADQHNTTTTTAAPATTTTAAPATATTVAPTTTAAPATTTTTARTTTTTAQTTATTAPASATTAPGSPPPADAGSTGSVSEPGTETPTRMGGTTVSRAPSRIISGPAPNRRTTKEFRQERRQAPPPEPPGDAGPQQNLGDLFEPEAAEPAAARVAERGGLATKPLATGGLVLGALAGLLLGLADRAGLSARSG